MMDAIVALAPTASLTAGACAALNVSRASVYRQRTRLARPAVARPPKPSPQRALTVVERRTVLDLLRGSRFADQAPAEVYASLLDEGVYHCSIRTMFASWPPTRRSASAALNCAIRSTRSRSCWHNLPTRSGRGT
jgi:transposase